MKKGPKFDLSSGSFLPKYNDVFKKILYGQKSLVIDQE